MKIERGGVQIHVKGVQMHAKHGLYDMPPSPPPPGKVLHFLFSEVAYSAFSGKNSAQNLINYKVFNSNDKLLSDSTDLLNILRECCYTNLWMISFNYMSTKRGGPDPLDPPPPPPPLGSAPASSVLSHSILKRSSAVRRDSPIVDLREVFVSFNCENERSAEAVVTGSLRHTLYRHAMFG